MMKKIYLVISGSLLTISGYANNSVIGKDMEKILVAFIAVLVISVIVISGIYIDTRIREKKKKNKGSSRNAGNGLTSPLDMGKQSMINEKLDLKEQVAELKKQLSEKESEIENLKEENDDLYKKILALDQKNATTYKDDRKDRKETKEKDFSTSNDKSSDALSGKYELTVINGNLVKAETEHTIYYQAWRSKDKLLFEFVNNDRTRKAINNRTIIIEPFCIKQDNSRSPDASKEIETIEPGVLNDDFALIKKVVILYK